MAHAAPTGPAPTPRKLSKWDRPKPPKDWRFWVGGLGKVLIATGLLMFGFVAYQLWGTGIETARAQNALESEFDDLLASAGVTTVPDSTVPVDAAPATTDVPPTTASPVPADAQNLPAFQEGDAVARLEIPRIGTDWIVVAGVEKSDLKKGPGHYPDTPLPGQLGNAAIAGHRTTYGSPFYSVEQLQPGDEIITTTPAGRFVYIVTGQQIVSPSDYQVVATTDPTMATLTLTSCHPRWTARERIVITSELDVAQSSPVGEPILNYGRPNEPQVAEEVPTDVDSPTVSAPVDTATTGSAPVDSALPGTGANDPTTRAPDTEADDAVAAPVADHGEIADAFAEGWFSDPGANSQVALWGLALTVISIGAYLISRKTRHDSIGFLVGIVPFAIALYFFFQNVNRLLPPNL